MKKMYIGINSCQPGMRIAETIYNEYGAVIIGESTVMDMHLIKKLENLGFARVRVYDETESTIMSNNSEVFKAEYNDNVDSIKAVLHEISNGNSINTDAVNNVSESIVVRLNENRDIVSCINQIRSVNEYTYTHSINVFLLSMLIGKWLKYDYKKIKELTLTGLVHDIGKGRVPAEILNKPGELTSQEFEEIKKHSIYGYRILENSPEVSKDVRLGVLMHHEREDGSGYPTGAKAEQICDYAKIIAVADIYDAMTSNRVYKEKESPFEVFELMENKTFGILDPRVVSVFLKNLASYYIGDMARLSNGEIGEIVYINPMHISQPLIKLANDKYIDLSKNIEIRIMELL